MKSFGPALFTKISSRLKLSFVVAKSFSTSDGSVMSAWKRNALPHLASIAAGVRSASVFLVA
jgi:hypothetical protein